MIEVPAEAVPVEPAGKEEFEYVKPRHSFSLRSDQPPYAIYHDANAYYVIMVLPAVEPGNCWTQVWGLWLQVTIDVCRTSQY